MATGLLASANLNGTSDTIVSTAPATADVLVVAKIFLTNRNASAISVRLALGSSGETAIGAGNSIEFDVTLPAYGILERGNIMLGASQRILARTGTAGVSVAVCGVEQP